MAIDPTLARCAIELREIQESMSLLAFSRLADTAAWVHASWTLVQAQGALRRAEYAPHSGTREMEAASSAVRSARMALRALESLRLEPNASSGYAAVGIGGPRPEPASGPRSE
jgi:hypothetical protein